MIRTALFVVVSTMFAQLTLASQDPLMRIEMTGADEGRLVPDDSASPQTPSTKLWDNWSDRSDGGITVPHTRYRIGANEVGETCYGVPQSGGRLGDLAFTLYNYSSSTSISRFRQHLRIYSLDSVLIAEVSALISGSVPARTGAGVRFGENSLLGFYGTVPDNFIFTIQFSEITGIDISDVGVTVGGPISAGTSPPLSFNRTTGEQIDLPGDDHFMMFVHTDSIPTPGVLALAALTLPVALRRRR